MATSNVSLADVLDLVKLTPGQASAVLFNLAREFGDSDPEVRTAFLTAAEAVVAPPAESTTTKITSTKSST